MTTIDLVPNATIEFAIVRPAGHQIWFFLKDLKVENSAIIDMAIVALQKGSCWNPVRTAELQGW